MREGGKGSVSLSVRGGCECHSKSQAEQGGASAGCSPLPGSAWLMMMKACESCGAWMPWRSAGPLAVLRRMGVWRRCARAVARSVREGEAAISAERSMFACAMASLWSLGSVGVSAMSAEGVEAEAGGATTKRELEKFRGNCGRRGAISRISSLPAPGQLSPLGGSQGSSWEAHRGREIVYAEAKGSGALHGPHECSGVRKSSAMLLS